MEEERIGKITMMTMKPLDERVRETIKKSLNDTALLSDMPIEISRERYNQATTSILKIIDEYVRSIVPEEVEIQDIFWKNLVRAKDEMNNYVDDKKIARAIRQTILKRHKEFLELNKHKEKLSG